MSEPAWRRASRLHDAVREHADPLDLELDDVAPLEPPAVAVLEDAAGADGPRADDVAGAERRIARRMVEDPLPRVVEVAQVPARALLAVHPCDHLGLASVELVDGDDDRAE